MLSPGLTNGLANGKFGCCSGRHSYTPAKRYAGDLFLLNNDVTALESVLQKYLT
jgi:hypothetical protein